jgi:hypothetical protein
MELVKSWSDPNTNTPNNNRSRMGREGNRKAYPCRIFVAAKAAPVARRRVSPGVKALEQPCSPLFYLHSPPTPRSSLLRHPQPHVLLRPQRRAPGTTAAALSTGTERGRKGRLRERDERRDGGGGCGAQGGEWGRWGATESDPPCASLLLLAQRKKWAVVAVVWLTGWADKWAGAAKPFFSSSFLFRFICFFHFLC